MKSTIKSERCTVNLYTRIAA